MEMCELLDKKHQRYCENNKSCMQVSPLLDSAKTSMDTIWESAASPSDSLANQSEREPTAIPVLSPDWYSDSRLTGGVTWSWQPGNVDVIGSFRNTSASTEQALSSASSMWGSLIPAAWMESWLDPGDDVCP